MSRTEARKGSSLLRRNLLQDLQGGEFHYNAEIKPWFHLTADLQVIQTEIDSQSGAVVVGLRGRIDTRALGEGAWAASLAMEQL